MSNPFGQRRNSACPSRGGFSQPGGERCHEVAIAVTVFEKPLAAQWLMGDPTEQISVNLWPDRFHQIASQAIASWGVKVHHAKAGV
jgi:hypothetical protein